VRQRAAGGSTAADSYEAAAGGAAANSSEAGTGESGGAGGVCGSGSGRLGQAIKSLVVPLEASRATAKPDKVAW
jgi:hypothetical protein